MTRAVRARLTDTLREHLAKRDTRPKTWYALQLIATRGPGLDRGELAHVLSGSRSEDDVETTVRTLRAITDAATEDQAEGGGS
jgi:hypothetical protein